MTYYELWYGRTSYVKYFRVFGRKWYIKRDEENLGKIETRADEGIFLGYSTKRKAYIYYNKRLRKLLKSQMWKFMKTLQKVKLLK